MRLALFEYFHRCDKNEEVNHYLFDPMKVKSLKYLFASFVTLLYRCSNIRLTQCYFIGMGLGTFQSIDFALVMDVLPDEKDKAKDIAVWHQALVLPNAIATPTGGIILDYFESVDCTIGLGYIILFAVTAFYFLLSAIFVTKIKRAN